MNAPVSTAAVKAIADAIFKERPSTVLEAYSDYGQELRSFQSAPELCEYVDTKRDSPAGSVHIAVHYPDVAGTVTRIRIALDSSKCDGHTYRYKVDGWGLIWVYLQLRPSSLESFVSANSEKRAAAWVPTRPELAAPSTWDWSSVTLHLRRLRRALKLAA